MPLTKSCSNTRTRPLPGFTPSCTRLKATRTTANIGIDGLGRWSTFLTSQRRSWQRSGERLRLGHRIVRPMLQWVEFRASCSVCAQLPSSKLRGRDDVSDLESAPKIYVPHKSIRLHISRRKRPSVHDCVLKHYVFHPMLLIEPMEFHTQGISHRPNVLESNPINMTPFGIPSPRRFVDP